VDVAQGVHDALERNASQRPATEREVEPLARKIECFCVVHGETDAAALLVRERCARGRDVLAARVEGVDGGSPRRCERSEAAAPAADIEDAFALERDEVGDRGRFDPGSSRRCICYGFGLYALRVVPRAPNLIAFARVSSNLERA
jgi:hypothetical protein